MTQLPWQYFKCEINIQNYTNYVFVVKNAYNFVILFDQNQLLWRYVINIMNFFDNKWTTWEKLVSN